MFDKIIYLCRNKNNINKYTAFATKVGDDSKPIFQEPVGYGEISNSLKTHMEVQFTFPRQRIFLSLFPCET